MLQVSVHACMLPGLVSLSLLAACGLERDWAAFQEAFAGDSASSGTGSTTRAPEDSEGPGGDTTEEASTGSSGGSSGGESTGGGAAAGTTSEDTSTGATSEPSEVCGDGVVAGEEECDDGNDEPTDLCDNECARAWTIFVTSVGYDGNINGLVGTGNRCRNLAGMANLPRWEKYVALISDSTTNAADRLHHAKGYYRLVNGLPVAHGWDALMTGPLEYPINVTELSTTLSTAVWTGSLPGGTAVPGSEHCEGWMTDSPFVYGHIGSSSSVDSGWIYLTNPDINPTPCAVASKSLYCVEQP